jgi:hypothetical protein
MIYTINSFENLDRIMRKATKNKLSFESLETLRQKGKKSSGERKRARQRAANSLERQETE